MTRSLAQGSHTLSRIIFAMHLHEDGQKVDVIFADRSSIEVDIRDILRLSEGALAIDNGGFSIHNSFERV